MSAPGFGNLGYPILGILAATTPMLHRIAPKYIPTHSHDFSTYILTTVSDYLFDYLLLFKKLLPIFSSTTP